MVDRQKAGTLGLSEQQVAQTVLTSLVGNTQFAPIPFTDEKTGNEYYINVRLDDAYRSHVDDMRRSVHAHAVGRHGAARHHRAASSAAAARCIINRKYLQRIIDVTANVAPGKDLGGASQAVQRVLDELPPPEGFTVRLGGQTEAQQTGVRRPVVRGGAGDPARLHGAGVAVQVADRSAGDHVQRAAGRDRRVRGAVADRHDAVA